MYKRGGHMRGVSQRRPAPSPSPSSSSSSSPTLSSSPVLSSNPQPIHAADGQRGHIGPSSDPQHVTGQLGDMRTESPSVPPSSSVPPSPLVQHSNDEEDSRFMICPCGDSFTDAIYVVRELNKIINNCWMGQYISFSTAPKEVKDLWWNEFKRKFSWDETKENEVRRIFKKKAGDHMRNVMNRAKRSQQKPDFITADNWTEIKRSWDTKKHKQLSEQNKKNRASSSSKGFATYAGGSINIGEHRKRMADELGTKPTFIATFKRTFHKKDNTWTGGRAKDIKEKYDELLMSTASGSEGVVGSEPSVDNMALWVEASGGIRRGQIFGMGSLSKDYVAAASSSSNAAVSRRTRRDEQMTQELSQLKHLLLQKDKEITGLKQQMQLILRHLNLNHNEVPPVPP